MREKLEKSLDFPKLSGFFLSKYFRLLSLGTACVITVFHLETAGLVIFVLLISAALIFCEEIIATTLPFILVSMFMIKRFDSYDEYIGFIWLAIPAGIALLVHFYVYHKPYTLGKSFWGVVSVAIAVTLGGVGSLSFKEYFNLTSIYYVVGLGVGMVILYLLMNSQFSTDNAYPLEERFSEIMHYMGIFACFMVISYYAVNINEVIKIRGTLDFQWRNNISTFLMLAMPFPFYLSLKKASGLWTGILCYVCILLAGSRGGTVFGSIEFLFCFGLIIVADKGRRKEKYTYFYVIDYRFVGVLGLSS